MHVDIVDYTHKTNEFADLETGKVKIIVLDGVSGTIKLIQLPQHGETTIQTAKGKAHKVKLVGEYLI
ncbi:MULTISPECIES: XtrA/YqaO family protein [Sporosarcina]|uniref:Methionyl-tRNA formyltransferase n=1 Tax=Sporosarcina psychrophila TaxID=1476 RepID=A0ABV2KAP4_SPOPS|nr:XtrA/YqaO family protein [Sporosarcina sp. E16_8]MBO0586476.1 hypothetical protein [Sporosarcina sp. E16_8]